MNKESANFRFRCQASTAIVTPTTDLGEFTMDEIHDEVAGAMNDPVSCSGTQAYRHRLPEYGLLRIVRIGSHASYLEEGKAGEAVGWSSVDYPMSNGDIIKMMNLDRCWEIAGDLDEAMHLLTDS